jgi:hypothetical protein
MTAKLFPGRQEFLFQSPLYESFKFSDDLKDAKALLYYASSIDGYCRYCKKLSTFRSDGPIASGAWEQFQKSKYFDSTLTLTCARNSDHEIKFFLLVMDGVVQKVGQYPSFADIALDESKSYGNILTEDDKAELHKAIGLAAHGVGIGSFVYVRRIFERLIQKRFEEFKDVEKWVVEDFKNLRMTEKIDFLREHLPKFLVENKKIYGVLSLGIHELDEEECLQFFEIMKASTIIILEEDKKKKEQLALQAKLSAAIGNFPARNR